MLTNSARLALLSYISPRLVTFLDIDLRDFRKKPPLLIYQMGKVGSQSIFHALRNSGLPNPIYHIHSLYRAEGKTEKKFKDSQVCRNEAIGDALNRKLRGIHDYLIITGTRDPIARELSEIFQNSRWTMPEVEFRNDRESILEVSALVERMMRERLQTRTLRTLKWFDQEFLKATDIDIFEYPFDPSKGYSIFQKEGIRVLLIRQENLNEAFHPGISELFNVDLSSIPLLKKNLSFAKTYQPHYEYCVENFVLPADILRPVYEHKYSEHFYPDLCMEFLSRWSA